MKNSNRGARWIYSVFLPILLTLLLLPGTSSALMPDELEQATVEVIDGQRTTPIPDSAGRIGKAITVPSFTPGNNYLSFSTNVANISMSSGDGIYDINIINSHATDPFDGALVPSLISAQSQNGCNPGNGPVSYSSMAVQPSNPDRINFEVAHDISSCFTDGSGNALPLNSVEWVRSFESLENSAVVRVRDVFINNTNIDLGGTADDFLTYRTNSGIDGSEEFFLPDLSTNTYSQPNFNYAPTSGVSYLRYRNVNNPAGDSHPYIGWEQPPSSVYMDSSQTSDNFYINYQASLPAGGTVVLEHVVGNAESEGAADLQVSQALGLTPVNPNSLVNIATLDASSCPAITATIDIDPSILQMPISESQFSLTEAAGGQSLSVSSFTVTPIGSSGGSVAIGLALDRSGSFSSQQGALNTASQQFVAQMNSGDQMSIVEFGSSSAVKQTLTSDASALNNAITSSSIVGTSNTYLYTSIIDSINEVLNSSSVRAVVAITDGFAGDTSNLSAALSLAQQHSIKVYTIGFGSSINTTELQQFSADTGGAFYQAVNTGDISTIYGDIRQAINQQIRVDYSSPFNAGTSDQRTLSLSYAGQTTTTTYQCNYSGVQIRQIAADAGDPPDVDVFFDVQDPQGNPITGLTSLDMCGVTERGQTISNYSLRTVGQGGSSAVSLSFVLDRSGSFNSEQSAMNAAVSDVINNMQTGDRYALVNFGSSAATDASLTASTSNLLNAVGNPSGVGGNTALYDGISLGAAELSGVSGQKAMIVITDGADTASSLTLSGAINDAVNAGVPVYMIAFGSSYNSSVFDQIASQTNGSVQVVATTQELTNLVASLRGTFSQQYVLEYTSPFDRTVDSRRVEICVNNYGIDSGIYQVAPNNSPAVVTIGTGYNVAPGGSIDLPIQVSGLTDVLAGLDFSVISNGSSNYTISAINAAPGTGGLATPNGNQAGIVWPNGVTNGGVAVVTLDIPSTVTPGTSVPIEINVNVATDVNGNALNVVGGTVNLLIVQPTELSFGAAADVSPGDYVRIPLSIDTHGVAIGAVEAVVSSGLDPLAPLTDFELDSAFSSTGVVSVNPTSSQFGVVIGAGVNGSSTLLGNIVLRINDQASPGVYQVDISSIVVRDINGNIIPNEQVNSGSFEVLILADGDVAPLGNRDGVVNIGDAVVALRYALGIVSPIPADDLAHGDVAPLDSSGQPNPDGVLNIGDAVVILRKALNIITF